MRLTRLFRGLLRRLAGLPGWCFWVGVLTLTGLVVWAVYDRAASGESTPYDHPSLFRGRP